MTNSAPPAPTASAATARAVVSPSRWERRLVGSTIATMPYLHRRAGNDPEVVRHGLPLLGQLMGDAEPEVQKALSWAYRSLSAVDRAPTVAALQGEAERAAGTGDGYRAWVIRDSLTKLDPATADRLRDRLAGIRRHADGPSTSEASLATVRFGGLPDPTIHPEPPRA
jgi:hypothetical protein